MNLLGTLLAKDLRRAQRSPIALAINLAIPFVLTALIGLAVGGTGKTGGMGRIKLGIVDEDNSPISQFLRGAINQGEGAKYLEPVFLSRDDAMKQITDNQISAVVVLPKDFARDYLIGRELVKLELIKNPAQSFYPAIVEELLGALVTALNAIDRSLRSELREWQALFERGERPSPQEVADLVAKTGSQIEAARDYLYPPLITYTKANKAEAAVSVPGHRATGEPSGSPTLRVFAYILSGMAAMFLLLIADNAIRDVYREQRFRTFQRYQSLQHELYSFLGAKVVFTVLLLILSGLILFGGGTVILRIHWNNPGALAVLTLAYALFAAGFMALVASLAGTERRADTLNTILAMALGLAGGCMFPPEQMPAFIGRQITPWMPTYWFAGTARGLQFGGAESSWIGTASLLAGLGLGLVFVAAWFLRRQLQKGTGS